MHPAGGGPRSMLRLNESPSEKEGKCAQKKCTAPVRCGLNESPSEKEGKYPGGHLLHP